MAERLYIPSEYLDEVCPQGRASPNAWLTLVDGAVRLAGDGDDGMAPEGRALAAGEVVSFTWVEDLPEISVRIRSDKTWSADRPVPPAVTHFWLRYDPETLMYSMDEFVAQMADNDGSITFEGEIVDVAMAIWAESDEDFRLVSICDIPSFIPTTPGSPS